MTRSAEALRADCEASLAGVIASLEPLRGSSVLITGVTGFVGSWLTVLLTHLNDRHGFKVRITGCARHRARLAEQAGSLVQGRDDFKFITADIRQFIGAPSDVDWIIHAAGSPDNRRHATDPVETMSVIGEGTARILRLAEQAAQLKNVLHFSSGLVYGPEQGPRREDKFSSANPVDASNAYAEAKRYSETLCAAFRSQSRLPIVIARPFTFIGPFQPLDAPWAANNFLHAAVNRQPLKVLGDGESRRTFLYGSDMAVLALLQLVKGQPGEAYNLGGAEALSLRELAEDVVAASGRPLEIRYQTGRAAHPASSFIPDLAKCEETFGFRAAISVSQAIRRTLEWHGLATGGKVAYTA